MNAAEGQRFDSSSFADYVRATTLEQLLNCGGDARSALDARTGLNKFGCAPFPRPEAVSFGSSTASSISKRAFCSVDQERRALLGAACPIAYLDARMQGLRQEIQSVLGLGTSEAEVVFSPSGTDSTLHALAVTRALLGAAPLDCILAASDETGTGVPWALAGRHFSAVTAEGTAVTEGKAIADLAEGVTLRPVTLRGPGGMRRTEAEVDAEIKARAAEAVKAGRKVLLQAMDGSKLGARSPSLDCLRALARRHGDSLQIVVDACQMRLGSVRLKWHLAQGHLVLVSGSKFFTGPPFSGALLVPGTLAVRLSRAAPLAAGLSDYTNRLAWPQNWEQIREALPERANVGQFFRWVAALHEMQAYYAIPWAFRDMVLNRFAGIVFEQIRARRSDFVLLDEGRAHGDAIDDAEMSVRTIFPFLVRREGRFADFETARRLHDLLNQNALPFLPPGLTPDERELAAKPCHIGQPVRIGVESGPPRGALRLCAGARTVTEVWASYQNSPRAIRMEREKAEAALVLDKLALLSRALPKNTVTA